MRVAAALCWYDEPPDLLEQCVRSIAPFVDHLVAVDGTWDLWEEREPRSPIDQYDTLRRVCRQQDVRLTLVGDRWRTQCEKRGYAIGVAAADADWVMPLDADWTFHGNPSRFRAELDATTADSGVVAFDTPPGPNEELFHKWHRATAGVTQELPLVWRALPDIRCEPEAHWCYTAEGQTGRVSLWGPTIWPDATRFHVHGLRIVHHCFERPAARVIANVDYVNRREELKLSVGYEP